MHAERTPAPYCGPPHPTPHVEVPRVEYEKLTDRREGECSADVRVKVEVDDRVTVIITSTEGMIGKEQTGLDVEHGAHCPDPGVTKRRVPERQARSGR